MNSKNFFFIFCAVLSIPILFMSTGFAGTEQFPSNSSEDILSKILSQEEIEKSKEESDKAYREIVSQPNFLAERANLSKMTMISLVEYSWNQDEKRLQCLTNQLEFYSNQLNQMKNEGKSAAEIDEHIRNVLLEQEWKDGIDLYEHPEKFLNKAALCLVAAQIESTVPLELLADEFGFSVRAPKGSYSFNEHHIPETLCDYPLMYLAKACGEKSIPFLKGIIECKKELTKEGDIYHWDKVRLQAFIVLYNIDQKEAQNLIPEFARDLSKSGGMALQKFLDNPTESPLKVYSYIGLRTALRGKRNLERLDK